MALVLIATFLRGETYPTIFLAFFSLIIIFGDFIKKEDKLEKFSYPFILNLALYINLPILLLLVFFVISIFSNSLPLWYLNFFNNVLHIDITSLGKSFNIVDKFSIIFSTSLFIGSMGTVTAHELTHRKKKKFDMFIGNCLLSFSWDCNFAIEHVYGHHKNVCLDSDPASAKRGENIYLFILRSIFDEQISGWRIESARLKRKNKGLLNHNNRMLIGYLRSLILTILIFTFGGLKSTLVFLLCALVAKFLLEGINYIEHYGLVREEGKPVRMRHSWNSNHFFSSIYLYNVTRHSDHHRNSNLKYWELKPVDKDAPMLPYGYLTMLYFVLFLPFVYKFIMKKELQNWDNNFANDIEKSLLKNSIN